MKFRLASLLMVVVCIALVLGGCGGSSDPPLQVGDKHPDFSLKGIDAETHSLSSLVNKKTMMIYVFRDCTGCEISVPLVETAYKDLKSKLNVAIIFGKENIMTVTDYVNKKKWGLSPILIDETDSLYKKYGLAEVRPVTVLLDSQGIIQKIKVGPFSNPGEVATWVGVN
jgi:peroxiredoxin